MKKTWILQLEAAKNARRLIRFSTKFEASTRGYVLEMGPKHFLLALVSDHIWFDGFECFRVSDLTELNEDPYFLFAEAALEARGEHIPAKPNVNLASIGELLITANSAFPLVTVHCEQADSNVCWLGRVVGLGRGYCSFLEINPDATWEDTPRRFRLSEITRIGFGADYEDALHLVGGGPNSANNE